MTWIKKNRLIVLLALIAVAGFTYWLIKQRVVETGISLEKAKQLRKGMSYDEVVAIIGCPPGTYNESLRNENPSLRRGKGAHLTMEDADIENVSLLPEYEHVYWRDYQGVQVKVMFTRDARQLHRVDTYRYVRDENAFRYADPAADKAINQAKLPPSGKNDDSAPDDEAVIAAALAHFAKEMTKNEDEDTRGKRTFVVNTSSLGPSFYLSEDQLTSELRQWEISAELRKLLRERNEKIASVAGLIRGGDSICWLCFR